MKKPPKTYLSTALSGSARETALRLRNLFQGERRRPNGAILLLGGLVFLLFGSLVSCQAQAAVEPPPQTCPPEYQSYAALPSTDVDGDGAMDTVLAFAAWDETSLGTTTVQVTLSDGTCLERRWEEGSYVSLQAAPLLGAGQNAIVLERGSRGSNYGAASLSVFQVSGGVLEEALTLDGSAEETLGLAEVSGAEAAVINGTWALRVPALVDKWHSPEWHTFRWTGTAWDHTTDGYFTDLLPITVSQGRTLTLAFRGRRTDGSYSRLIYDQIQVLDGEKLIQTITEADVVLDDRYLFDGFLAWDMIEIRDVNFDSAEDFGLLCGSTYNGPICWFVWDETTEQFRHSFFSALGLALDEKKQQQIDTWSDGNLGTDSYVYTYDEQGERVLTDSYRMEHQ